MRPPQIHFIKLVIKILEHLSQFRVFLYLVRPDLAVFGVGSRKFSNPCIFIHLIQHEGSKRMGLFRILAIKFFSYPTKGHSEATSKTTNSPNSLESKTRIIHPPGL